jgi:hypothetical protein
MERGRPLSEPGDEMIEVEDLDDWNAAQFPTREQALDHVLDRLRHRFSEYDFLK